MVVTQTRFKSHTSFESLAQLKKAIDYYLISHDHLATSSYLLRIYCLAYGDLCREYDGKAKRGPTRGHGSVAGRGGARAPGEVPYIVDGRHGDQGERKKNEKEKTWQTGKGCPGKEKWRGPPNRVCTSEMGLTRQGSSISYSIPLV